jgi:hypothetical protein
VKAAAIRPILEVMRDGRCANRIARAGRGRATALACAAALAMPAAARADGSAEGLRAEHERCQQLRAAGQDGEAGTCFERVYVGVTGLEPRASRDLFNVLVDATTAYQRANATDREPGHLCRAAFLIRDYLERPQKAEAIVLRRRANELAGRVDAALVEASRTAGRDVCREPAPAAVEVEERPQAGTAETPGTSGTPGTPAPALKRLPATRPAPYTGRSRWAAPDEPGIELLAAGFAVTVGGAVTSSIGIGLLLYRAECTSDTPDCSDAALADYHDAGYLTLAAGAGIILAGASILFADRIIQRKRQASTPRVGFGGTGVALSGRF